MCRLEWHRLWCAVAGLYVIGVITYWIATSNLLCRCVGAKKSTASDVLFDDDDMLGSMGLESPKPVSRKSTLLLPESQPETGARSVLDTLLQGSKKTSQSEKSTNFMSSSLKAPGLFKVFLFNIWTSRYVNDCELKIFSLVLLLKHNIAMPSVVCYVGSM